MSEDAFIHAILASPEDASPCLVYADWLEERGDPRGEYLRLLCALDGRSETDRQATKMRKRLRILEGNIDRRWRALFSVDLRIERIKVKLRTAVRGNFQPFGVEDHGFRRRRRLTERQVAGFERRHGIELPPEYRAFIIGVTNGGVGPAYSMFSLAEAVTKERGRVPDDFLRTPFPHTDAYNPSEDEPDEGSPSRPSTPPWAWTEEDEEDEEDEGEESSLYQDAGTLVLCHEGCGILHLLVVMGPSRGQMWVDDRCNDQGLYPLGVGFLDWYERWLDSTLARGNGVWWHGDLE
jgi:uncharacterized protein (TIGR02996 family)